VYEKGNAYDLNDCEKRKLVIGKSSKIVWNFAVLSSGKFDLSCIYFDTMA
jgi:hypothetical protein